MISHANEARSGSDIETAGPIARIASQPTTHYVLALLLLALAAIASHSVLVHSLSELEEDALIINTSGLQRMLSEQTLRLASELTATSDVEEKRAVQNQLQTSLGLMRSSHEQLAQGVRQRANGSGWDHELQSAYFDGSPSLDARLNAYFGSLEEILDTSAEAASPDQGAYRSLVLAHRDGLLRDLDQVVILFEQRAQARLKASEDLYISLMFVMLALLLVVAVFIFRPLVRRQERAQEELLEARDDARAQVSERSNVLAAVSHEIRTPLGGVLGIINQLKRERSPIERERALDLMEDSCGALLDTLDAILQQSRLGEGAEGLLEKRFTPRALAFRVAELFRPVARRKALAIEVHATTGREARGDAARIQQVLSNLVSNSVKFTQSGVITIFVQEPKAGSNEWVFVVSDTGSGMGKERLEAIFEPFGHSAHDTLGRTGGAGLGLSITRDLVEALGGRIEVESELGEGSSFTVLIPLVEPEQELPDAIAQMNDGCVALLIERASDRIQAEAAAQLGYTVCDLGTDTQSDPPDTGDLTIVADAALVPQLGEDLARASRLIIVLGDAPDALPDATREKCVFVSHNQLARSLGELLEGQAA